MSDYSELKKRAEAATAGPWIEQDDEDSAAGAIFIVPESDTWIPPICRITSEHNAAYVAAANPSAILELISENERIKARLCVCRDCSGHGEIYSGHDAYQGQFQPPEPEMDVCGTCGGDGVLGPLEDFESLTAERDRIKSERDELIRAMEVLLLHVKPAKLNAVALNHAYQVLTKFKAVKP